MAWLTPSGHPQAVGAADKKRKDRAVSCTQGSAVPPACDQDLRRTDRLGEMAVIVWANGVRMVAQMQGVWSAQGEKIDDFTAPRPPAPGKTPAATQGGVISGGIGGTGIEQDKGDTGERRVPRAPQPVAVGTTWVQDRTTVARSVRKSHPRCSVGR